MHNHEYFGSISGALFATWYFSGSNVIGERKKHKAQVELLQLRIPPNPKKTESPETKLEQSRQRNTDPLLIFWNTYLRKYQPLPKATDTVDRV